MIAEMSVSLEADLRFPCLAVCEQMTFDSNLLSASSMAPMDDCNHDCIVIAENASGGRNLHQQRHFEHGQLPDFIKRGGFGESFSNLLKPSITFSHGPHG